MSMKASILNLVIERKAVSFVQISRLSDAKGDCAIEHGRSNVILWTGLSFDAVQAVIDLRNEGLIHYAPTPTLTYLIDGATLSLPLAKRASAIAKGYKQPHWLPVVINPGPGDK